MAAILSRKNCHWQGDSLQAIVNPWSKTALWGGFLGWLSDFFMLLLFIQVMNTGQIGGEGGLFHGAFRAAPQEGWRNSQGNSMMVRDGEVQGNATIHDLKMTCDLNIFSLQQTFLFHNYFPVILFLLFRSSCDLDQNYS